MKNQLKMASLEKLKEIKEEYKSSLNDLTINSKPLINMLTMLAEDNIDNASIIVKAVEEHLEKVRSEYKLPVLYLIDSIVKNVGNAYKALFTQNIVSNFCGVFDKVDERIRAQMFKLRQTWSEVFPAKKMYTLDVRVSNIDPAWPIIAPPPTPSIHVNPKFFNKSAGNAATPTVASTPATTGARSSSPEGLTAPVAPVATVTPSVTSTAENTFDMRAHLITKQKELLELQQRKIELELLQARVKLEEQQKQYEMAQKRAAEANVIVATTTATLSMPSMKTVLTKPTAVPTTVKSAVVEPKSSSKSTTKRPSQVVMSLSKFGGPANGQRIAPVNSALLASARSASRDPRLAAKQAHQEPKSTGTNSADISALIENKSSKIDQPVMIEKTEKHKLNHTSDFSNKTTVNKASNLQTKSLSTIKDPRLISSKVHGASSQGKGKSGSRDSSRAKGSGVPLTARKLTKSQRAARPEKVIDITDTSCSNNKLSKNDKNTCTNPKSRSTSRSPTKPKRKEHASPQKKLSASPSKRSPDKHTKYGKRSREHSKYDLDVGITSPAPSPSATDVGAKTDEKAFKELKGSTKSRNYMRRNRAASLSPDSAKTKDVDLRIGGPPEKHPRLQTPPPSQDDADHLPTIPTKKVPEDGAASKQPLLDVPGATNKDIDLRQMHSGGAASIAKKRSSTDKLEHVNPKKSKAEMFDVLFGNEDVDLRTLPSATTSQPPAQPPTPPPPIISSPPAGNNNGWARVKETKSPTILTPNTHLATVRAKLANATNKDRLGRPLLYNKLPDDPSERKRTISLSSTGDIDLRRPPRALSIKTDAASIKRFLQQAEDDRQTGKMSATQYQCAMQQVITLIEKQKLRQAQRMENSKDKKRNPELNMSLQPISDDELSADFSEDEDEIDTRKPTAAHDIDDRQVPPAPIISLSDSESSVKNDGKQQSPERPTFSPDSSSPEKTLPVSRPKVNKSSTNTGKSLEQVSENLRPGNSKPDSRMERDNCSIPANPRPNRRWDPPPNEQPQPWERSHNAPRPSPWIHPPLGVIEQQNQFVPWGKPMGNFVTNHPMSMSSGPHGGGPPKDLPDIRPNVAVGGFVQRPPATRYGPRTVSPPAIGSQTTRELPHADPLVLEYITNDSMRAINIDGNPTEIRYYGETAVAIMNGEDPIEISFQNGTRRISFGDKESYLLSFNDVAREVMISGMPHRVRLGAPTRELYIDDKWYECFFGGPGIVIEIDREYKVVKLEGPPPQVKIGTKRYDICAGRINLIINAKNIVPIFLDAKPQKFDIEGKIHTLRFVDALRTVLINEEPFKVDFGGLPKPIIVHNKKHFIRFTRLPPGVRPGYVDIKDMEGQRVVGSPPRVESENSMDRNVIMPAVEAQPEVVTNEPALPMMGKRRPVIPEPITNESNEFHGPTPSTVPNNNNASSSHVHKTFNLDFLSSIITTSMAPSSQINAGGYHTDPPVSNASSIGSEIPGLGGLQPPQTPMIGLTAPPRSFEDLKELIQKLEATGILSNVSETMKTIEPKPQPTVLDVITKRVDFSQPETLKVKQPGMIAALYTGMQCSSCGVRFPPEHTMKYSRQHLDWHYRQNKKKKHSVRKANSRKWFYDVSDWIQFEEIEDLEEREKSWFENQQVATKTGEENIAEEPPEEIEIPSVDARSAGENPRCDVCYDAFDQFYNEDKEAWHLRMAIRVDDKLYHPLCYEDYKASLLQDTTANESTLDDSDLPKVEGNNETEDAGDLNLKNKDDISEENVDATLGSPVCGEGKSVEESSPVAVQKTATDEESCEDDVHFMDSTEPDVCIILPEEETTIVKIEDISDDIRDENNDVFKDIDDDDQQAVKSEKKTIDVVMADGSVVQIKSEPVDPDLDESHVEIVASAADTTSASVLSSIDGNVQLESAGSISAAGPSGRIKINISKPLISQQPKEPASSAPPQSEPITLKSTESVICCSEPPPPGEEPTVKKMKPALQGIQLNVLPAVSKGNELSGFCSIM